MKNLNKLLKKLNRKVKHTKQKNKIYCKDCKYFDIFPSTNNGRCCKRKLEKLDPVSGLYVYSNNTYDYKITNMNNDCKYFERRKQKIKENKK